MPPHKAPSYPRSLSQIEVWILAAFLCFLPLAEAPKNVLLYSFLIYWIYRSWTTSEWGIRDRLFEWPLAAIALLSLVPILSRSEGHLQALSNCVDFISIGCLMVITARSQISQTHQYLLVLAALSGICITVLYGFMLGRPFPSLHSVGHINQVAIYLGIATVWFATVCYWTNRLWIFLTSAGAFTALSLLLISTASRNALFGVFITLGSLPIMAAIAGQKTRAMLATGILALSIGLLFSFRPPALERQLTQTAVNQSIIDDARKSLWHSSWLVAKNAPPFGYGVGFFREGHTPSVLEKIVLSDGVIFNSENYVWTNHAHNLGLNWLVERGWLATILFALWAVSVSFIFFRKSLQSQAQGANFYSPRTGLAVLMSTLLMGIGNTSWHHEHGLLAAVFIGFSWAATQSARFARR